MSDLPVKFGAVVIVVFTILALANNMLVPVFEAPDEPAHFQYARLLAQGRGLPVQTDPERSAYAEGFNPPLYYLVPALILRWCDRQRGAAVQVIEPETRSDEQMIALAQSGNVLPPMNPRFRWWGAGTEPQWYLHTSEGPWAPGPLLAVRLMRLFSTFCAVATLWAVFLLARHVLPGHPAGQLVALSVVAFNPQFVFLASVLNSDNLVTALGTWLLVVLVGTFGRVTSRSVIAMGLLVGFGALAKTNMLFFCVPVLGCLCWGTDDRRSRWRWCGAFLLLVAVIIGWFFVRNALLYGATDIFGYAARERLDPVFVLPAEERWSFLGRDFAPVLLQTYWGWFGWLEVRMQSWQYVVYALVTIASLYSYRVLAMPENGYAKRGIVLLLWSTVLLNILALLAFNLRFRAHQGRLLFPSIGAFASLLGVAVELLWCGIPARRKNGMAVGLAVFLFLMVLYTQAFVIYPTYFPLPR